MTLSFLATRYRHSLGSITVRLCVLIRADRLGEPFAGMVIVDGSSRCVGVLTACGMLEGTLKVEGIAGIVTA